MKKKLTLFQSLLWIFSSALIFNGLTYGAIKGYQYWKTARSVNFKVPIKAIIQTGPQKEALKTSYLAELLGLSVDCPILSSDFDLKEAQAKLLASPVIKGAEVKVSEPGILYIDYTIRQPIAFLSDFENVALDQEGYPFPVIPFFTPKKLPEIYLGMTEAIEWNQRITGEKITLAFEILKLVHGPIVRDLFNVKRIDVSNAFEKSLGQREIILATLDELYSSSKDQETHSAFPRILRLSPKKYSQELSNYLKLREELLEKEKLQIYSPNLGETVTYHPQKIIDFRISQLAFIDEEK